MTTSRARLLVVCTGNVCRSPLAMLMLQRRLAPLSPVLTVTSAGTRAQAGVPMSDRAAAEARRLGLDPAGVLSRQLDIPMIAEADLVLTATLEHRSQVVAAHVPALRYTFTLNELSRLLGSAEVPELPTDVQERVHALARLGVSRRGLLPPAEPGAYDVPDPIGGSPRLYAEVTAMLDPDTQRVAAALLGGWGGPSPDADHLTADHLTADQDRKSVV